MGITRRSLVRSAAIVPFGAVKGTSANSAVTVGLIGSGGRGTFDATLLAKDPNARVTALCDVFDDRIERARKTIPAPDAKAYKDYSDLLASPVDSVIIATPVYLHPEHFEAAVRARKHIYMEKPAGLDVQGCRRVIRAADSADRSLNITFGFQQRYGQVYRKAKQVLDSGALGPIRMAHSHWIKGVNVSSAPHPRPQNEEQRIRDWHVWRDTFGDIIVETYCHGIDVLNWFLGGHALKAYGTGGTTVDRRGDLMDHCDVTFTYKDGIQAVLTGSQIAPVHYRSVNETFYGANAAIETAREYWTHYRGRGDILHEKSPRDITIDAIEEFVRRIKEGKPENTAVSGAESTLTAIMGRTAIYEKREVEWEEMIGRLTAAEEKEGFQALFDGRTLDGWEGAPGLWSVDNGAIAGSTDNHKIDKNTFLIYKTPFEDFVLRFDVRLRNGNSGMQFRSKRLDDFVMSGYQADASDAGERSAWGNFYEERGRGRGVMRTPDEGWQKARPVLQPRGWNSYEVLAEGNRIKLTFNGVVTIDTADDKAPGGFIGIQLHSGDPMRVEYRNIRIKRLAGKR